MKSYEITHDKKHILIKDSKGTSKITIKEAEAMVEVYGGFASALRSALQSFHEHKNMWWVKWKNSVNLV